MPRPADRLQTHANHRSYPHPAYLTAGLVLLVEAGRRAWIACTEFSAQSAWALAVVAALLVAWFYARRSAQIVQDRLIRLEMHLRLERLLGSERRTEIESLLLAEVIALRFASDSELPVLVERVRRGEFARAADIKLAVKSWRADWLRV